MEGLIEGFVEKPLEALIRCSQCRRVHARVYGRICGRVLEGFFEKFMAGF